MSDAGLAFRLWMALCVPFAALYIAWGLVLALAVAAGIASAAALVYGGWLIIVVFD